MVKVGALALGVALASAGAWAQDPPVAPLIPYHGPEMYAETLPAGIQLSGGRIELSPDQKLARAYALCMRYVLSYSGAGCDRVSQKWLALPTKNADADRAFIEDAARSVK